MISVSELTRQLKVNNYAWTNVTALSPQTQKDIALDMWRFIRSYYVNNAGSRITLTGVKGIFTKNIFKEQNIYINWHCDCIFCEQYYDNLCDGCCLPHSEPNVCDYYDSIDYRWSSRLYYIDKIIEAIESMDIDTIPYRRF